MIESQKLLPEEIIKIKYYVGHSLVFTFGVQIIYKIKSK